MNAQRWTIESVGYILIALCLGVVQLSLFTGQSILFSAAAILWLVTVIRDRKIGSLPGFFLPLALYALLTLVSAALSDDPKASFIDSKQLLMFLMVPIVARFVKADRATQVIDVVIAIGAAGALVGIVQFATMGYDTLAQRPVGPLGHWMTFSGVLMLVTCAAVARLIFTPVRKAWPSVAVPALLVALVVTNTRNAWIGAFLAVSCLLAIKNWRLIIIAPVIAALGFLVAPGEVQRRVTSIFSATDAATADPATRDRIVMWKVGADMIREHPLFGVGPEMVSQKYKSYRAKYPADVKDWNPHLHNNPIQIAAERGLPALAVWLWFVAAAGFSAWRHLRARGASSVAAAGLAAVISMLAAGMFEYNFGDSEFLMLFLGLITLPHVAARPAAPSAEARVARG